MKKLNRLNTNVPGLYFAEESPEVVAQRKVKNDRKLKIAYGLGVDLTRFDSEIDIDEVFKNKKEQLIYERDCLALSLLLDKGEPLSLDLVERLLTIKERHKKLLMSIVDNEIYGRRYNDKIEFIVRGIETREDMDKRAVFRYSNNKLYLHKSDFSKVRTEEMRKDIKRNLAFLLELM